MNASLWERASGAYAWIRRHNADRDQGEERTLRMLKLQEECGEAAQALIGLTGQNPRKGYTHRRHDVAAELCDVILSAAVAMHDYTDDPESFMQGFLEGKSFNESVRERHSDNQ